MGDGIASVGAACRLIFGGALRTGALGAERRAAKVRAMRVAGARDARALGVARRGAELGALDIGLALHAGFGRGVPEQRGITYDIFAGWVAAGVRIIGGVGQVCVGQVCVGQVGVRRGCVGALGVDDAPNAGKIDALPAGAAVVIDALGGPDESGFTAQARG